MFEGILELPDTHAWASLVGLLNPSEYFVTVDHSVLWQRHVAWSKPKGSELRQYITQRYSSNQVFLSLMLGAQLGVFFNSSIDTTQMRECLKDQSYGDLKYWIGLIVLLDACVTVVAIVINFTLWGMVSAISDTNTHCVMRSSIGQYIICLPPRFIVASLYLFLIWLLLWFIELLSGPMKYVVAFGVIMLFFQVVVPLSAFGRLIIHTGAMAKKRVIDEDLEKDLLPSGLHASLLIRATDRRRKYANPVQQYRKKGNASKTYSTRSLPADSAGCTTSPTQHGRSQNNDLQRHHSAPANHKQQQNSVRFDNERYHSSSLDFDVEEQIIATVNMLNGGNATRRTTNPNSPSANESNAASPGGGNCNVHNTPSSSSARPPRSKRKSGGGRHRRTFSNDSADFHFPRASILNSASNFALQDVVNRTLNAAAHENYDSDDDDDHDRSNIYGSIRGNQVGRASPRNSGSNWRPDQSVPVPKLQRNGSTSSSIDGADDHPHAITFAPFNSSSSIGLSTPSPRQRSRKSFLGSFASTRQNSSRRIIDEWAQEDDVRNHYGVSPPADLIPETAEELMASPTQTIRRTRASMLNQSRGLMSLHELVTRETMDSPASTDNEDDEEYRPPSPIDEEDDSTNGNEETSRLLTDRKSPSRGRTFS